MVRSAIRAALSGGARRGHETSEALTFDSVSRPFTRTLHLQGERARLLQEEATTQLATATNRNLFALTVVTTLLLPPAFITGYFGMNTKNLPFSKSDYGTLYATGLCVLAALFVYFLIRRYRMLG